MEVIKSFEREFEIVNAKIVTEDIPISQQYRENGDLEAYAKGYAGITRGYLYPYLQGMCRGEQDEALFQSSFPS